MKSANDVLWGCSRYGQLLLNMGNANPNQHENTSYLIVSANSNLVSPSHLIIQFIIRQQKQIKGDMDFC